MSASLARGASGRRKAFALAPRDSPGAGRPSPLRRAIARGRKLSPLHRAIAWGGAEGCRPYAARFQEGCRHARQPCARRFSGDGRPPPLRRAISWGRKAFALAPRDFLGPKGLRPRATRLPGAGRPSPLRRALPGRLRACPPALREALLRRRKAAALAPRASRRVAGMPASLARSASGRQEAAALASAIARGRKAFALAPRDCPGAGRQPPSRRAIVQGPKGRCPCTARFQEGCRHARQPCAKRFRETGGRRPRAAQMPGGRKAVALAPALPGGRGRTGCVRPPFVPAWDAAPGMGGA